MEKEENFITNYIQNQEIQNQSTARNQSIKEDQSITKDKSTTQSNIQNQQYLIMLKALQELPFSVGKKLLTDFLQGNKTNESVEKHRLYSYNSFGILALQSAEKIDELLQNCIKHKFIEFAPLQSNKFIKVLSITTAGKQEIKTPTLENKKIKWDIPETIITEQDKIIFENFNFFLNKYNDFQKKAVITTNKNILCIAGAGSGKTTTITKRIEFLTTFRSIPQQKILAISFTRKAKQELQRRLSQQPATSLVRVETFNSWCEQLLKQYEHLIYEKPVRVINYGDRIRLVRYGLSKNNLSIERAIDLYFSSGQKRGKSDDELMSIFVNDCFFILDYFKNEGKQLSELTIALNTSEYSLKEINTAKTMQAICKTIDTKMKEEGLRDYSDQLVETISFLKQNKQYLPQYDYIFIDEYQDINNIQMQLIELLNPTNLFCVGDPRQAIFGWRGSKIKYILEFKQKYPNAEILTLIHNYRSTKHIVTIINKMIQSMNLPDLLSASIDETPKKAGIIKFDTIDQEYAFILNEIKQTKIPLQEIFVLARTNRQLKELSNRLKIENIKHILRTDEIRSSIAAQGDEVTLATIHAIKGLEANTVYVIGTTMHNFPCRTTDHPIIEMIKPDDYDKEEEERRLLYVALSRAKEELIVTYTGTLSNFMTQETLQLFAQEETKIKQNSTQNNTKNNEQLFMQYPNKIQYKLNESNNNYSKLKQWRTEKARELAVPAYMVVNDKTLVELTQKNPMTLRDLEDIYGLGPNKIKRFGEEILSLIN